MSILLNLTPKAVGYNIAQTAKYSVRNILLSVKILNSIFYVGKKSSSNNNTIKMQYNN